MPSISTMMDISKLAMNTAMKQLDTVSHNIANANVAGYSRQAVVPVTMFPEKTASGYYGLGVRAATVVQYVDKLLLRRISDKTSEMSYQESRLTQLLRLESLSNEASDTSLGVLTTAFFSAWQNVSNNPESSAVREDLLETANTLAMRMQALDYDIKILQRDLDSYLDHAVTEVNSIARKIADLNQQIVRGEISGHTANDLRDERMALIDQLAVKMNIQWTEDPKGNITVVAGNGGKAIVHENYPRPSDADPLVFDYPQGALGVGDKVIRWQDTNVIMSYNEITGGEMGAWLQVRDYDIPQTLEILGEYTHTLIGAVNILHSNGAGLEKFETVTGSYITQTPNSRFGAQEQDLPFADIIHNGEISLWVYQNGMQHQYTISVSVNDSMQDVVQRINQTLHSGYPVLDTRQKPAAYLKENEYGEGYQFFMSSAPNSGVEFAFESDSSGLLAAMGVNTFFSGDHMSNIGLNDNITNDVKFIAAGRILPNGEHALGDNTTALRIAAIKDADIMSGGTQTLNESIIQWSAQLGTKIANTRDKYSFAEITHNELMTQRDNVSAVNSDEELINLIMFQRAYQAAAKLVTTADTLLQTILDLKR